MCRIPYLRSSMSHISPETTDLGKLKQDWGLPSTRKAVEGRR